MRFPPFIASLGIAGLLTVPMSVPVAASPAATGVTVCAADEEPAPQDVAFIESAHRNNLAEIAGGRIAWSKTTDSTVKNLAATVMRDHIHLDAALYDTARELRIFLPDEPSPEQQALNERYQAFDAGTFDAYYIRTQLAGHRKALKMIDARIAEGGDATVTELAAGARPVIKAHRNKFREAAKTLAGYSTGSARD